MAVLWVLMCGLIIYLADRGLLRPIYRFIGAYPGSDKIGHFVLIGASAGLLNLALGRRTVRFSGRGCCSAACSLRSSARSKKSPSTGSPRAASIRSIWPGIMRASSASDRWRNGSPAGAAKFELSATRAAGS